MKNKLFDFLFLFFFFLFIKYQKIIIFFYLHNFMNRSVEDIFQGIREELLEVSFEKDPSRYYPISSFLNLNIEKDPSSYYLIIESFLNLNIEGDIYELMKLANSEEQARAYLKRFSNLFSDFRGFSLERQANHFLEYSEYYIKCYHAYHNKEIN